MISPEGRRDLFWTASLEPRQCEKRMWNTLLEDCDLEVSTDSSDIAWGVYFQGRMHHGLWAPTAVGAQAHINVKELAALEVFLSDFLPQSANGCKLLWRTDNSTALSYIRREGGTVSLHLLEIARRILLLLHRRRISILPVYISSEENLQADAASRLQSIPDWRLPRVLFSRLTSVWGEPEIDLFATKESAQVERFFAWNDEEDAEAIDALAREWNFTLAYAFPPPQLIPRVVKVSTGQFILITPFWPAQKWFPPSSEAANP